MHAHARTPSQVIAARPVGARVTGVEGDIEEHGEITSEDVLYSRTIRTVHAMAVNQMSTTAIKNLMELQFHNGLEVSLMHIARGEPGAGGLCDWLQACRP